MRKGFRVLLMVVGGIVGGWAGYWIGHAFGWSTNADWPWEIGGGDGAIFLSMGLAVVGVLLTGLWLMIPPLRRARRLLETGVRAPGTILDVWDLGLTSGRVRSARRQFEFLVEVRPEQGVPRQARVTQWVPFDRVATLEKGREIMVRYDPEHPTRVAIELPEPALVG